VEVDVVLGILTTLGVLLGAIPLIRAYRRSRSHVRQVWVRLEGCLSPVDDDIDNLVRDGGRLIVRNAGDHPVWDVMVHHPAALYMIHFDSIGPGEVLEREIPEARMASVREDTVTLQVTDNHQRHWRWTPLQQRLEPLPARQKPLPRLVQWTARRWPASWHEGFTRLPPRLQRALWGYDPAGPTGEKIDAAEDQQRSNTPGR
jgi:hypothetical protein